MAYITKRGSSYGVRYTYQDEQGKNCNKWESFSTKEEAVNRLHLTRKMRTVQMAYKKKIPRGILRFLVGFWCARGNSNPWPSD